MRRARDSVSPRPRHTCTAPPTQVRRAETHSRHGKTRVCRAHDTPARRPRRCGVGRPTHLRRAPTQWCRGQAQVRRARDAMSPRHRHTCGAPATQACRAPTPRAPRETQVCRSGKHACAHQRRCVVGRATHARQASTHCVAAETHRVVPATRRVARGTSERYTSSTSVAQSRTWALHPETGASARNICAATPRRRFDGAPHRDRDLSTSVRDRRAEPRVMPSSLRLTR
jgi:hypothetical protein